MGSDRNTQSANNAGDDANGGESVFRADTDAMGRWFVWERLGPAGWVTIEPCASHEEATQLAREMNARLYRNERIDAPYPQRPEIVARGAHPRIEDTDARAMPGSAPGPRFGNL